MKQPSLFHMVGASLSYLTKANLTRTEIHDFHKNAIDK